MSRSRAGGHMDDEAVKIIERETALANFDHARDDFLQAIGKVPEDRLDYKPEGDDYSLRDIVSHVSGSMEMYIDVLNRIKEAEYREVRLASGEDDLAAPRRYIDERASLPLRSDTKSGVLDQMEQVHDRLAGMLREGVREEFARRTPVLYMGASEAYPTSASDILGWMTDHYHEHIEQVTDMLKGMKA